MHTVQEGRGAKVGIDRANKVLLFGIAAAALAVDQASKAWALAALGGGRRIPLIGSVFDLRLAFNPGSAFGLLEDFTFGIFIASSVITIVVIVWAVRDPAASPVLGLIIGGGLGNLADRVFRPPGPGRGEVVDFLYLSFWANSNLADVAIVTGVGLMLLMALKEEKAATRLPA